MNYVWNEQHGWIGSSFLRTGCLLCYSQTCLFLILYASPHPSILVSLISFFSTCLAYFDAVTRSRSIPRQAFLGRLERFCIYISWFLVPKAWINQTPTFKAPLFWAYRRQPAQVETLFTSPGRPAGGLLFLLRLVKSFQQMNRRITFLTKLTLAPRVRRQRTVTGVKDGILWIILPL